MALESSDESQVDSEMNGISTPRAKWAGVEIFLHQWRFEIFFQPIFFPPSAHLEVLLDVFQ